MCLYLYIIKQLKQNKMKTIPTEATKEINLTFTEAADLYDLLRGQLSRVNKELVEAVTDGEDIRANVLARKSAQIMRLQTKLQSIL